jgi:peptidoglycan/LPS O-acetylase OafA/YrhL
MKFKFENLDSIRTIAFLSTFLAHAFYTESDLVRQSDAFQWAIKFQEIFSFGVPIFFVLSGFLISYLMLKEQEESGKFNLKNFYVRRILRIWPVYFLVIIIGFVLFPLVRNYILHDPYTETANAIYYIFYLSNFDQLATTTLPYGVGLGPTWSVSIEEQFYVFWPLLFLMFKRKKFIYGILLVTISSLIFTLLFQLPPKHTLYCMMYLSIGGLTAYLAYYYKDFILKITQVHSIYFILSIISLFACMYLSSKGIGGFFIIVLISLLISYLLVYQCYSGKMELKKIPFFEKLGKYTYGLYLYHVICNFIAHILIDDLIKLDESAFTAVFLKPVLSLGLSLVLSYLSYHYFEMYFLKLKKRFSQTS